MIEKHEIFKSDLQDTKFWVCLTPSMQENASTQKKTALFYSLLYFFTPTNWHLSSVCKPAPPSNLTPLSPSHSHISNPHPATSWARSAAPGTDWAPPPITASEASGQHGATGTHRNKLLLIGGLKVTPFVEWWLKLSSAKCFPTQGAGNCSSHLKVPLSPWSQGSFGLSGHQLQCWTIFTVKKFC